MRALFVARCPLAGVEVSIVFMQDAVIDGGGSLAMLRPEFTDRLRARHVEVAEQIINASGERTDFLALASSLWLCAATRSVQIAAKIARLQTRFAVASATFSPKRPARTSLAPPEVLPSRF
jgi:hypothetical protein